jgi:peroxiredoxin family protein
MRTCTVSSQEAQAKEGGEAQQKKKKMAVVVFSGSLDRLTGVAMLVSGAVAMEYNVELYLMLWAVHAFKKENVGKITHLSEFKEFEPEMAKRLNWYDLIKRAKKLGSVKIYACAGSAAVWNVIPEDLELVDGIIGVGEIVERLAEADVALFV